MRNELNNNNKQEQKERIRENIECGVFWFLVVAFVIWQYHMLVAILSE